MKQRHADGDGGGSLVAVSSISAIHGTPRHAAYAASKAGLLGLVRSAAVELARYGVRSNALLPGWTIVDTHPEMRDDTRFVEVTTQRTPVRRWATPEDLAPGHRVPRGPQQHVPHGRHPRHRRRLHHSIGTTTARRRSLSRCATH